jgi:hypothetical protein
MPVQLYQSMQHHIPEGGIVYGCSCENSAVTDFPTCVFQTVVHTDSPLYLLPVENSLWKRLRTYCMTDYGMSECSFRVRSL